MTSSNSDTVTPAELTRYLAGNGWVERHQAPHLTVWSTVDDGFEVLLPLDSAFRDYKARLHDALQTIALAEERATDEVLADVTATTVDKQHFRLLPDSPSGTIRLVDIVDVARGVRDLMYTAAHATVLDAPALVQPRPRPSRVHTFVRSVLLVAPAPGSFVLSAHVPVVSETERSLFNRRVVVQLHRAIHALHTAAGEAARRYSISPFLERTSEGLSANLCEAVGLIGQTQPFDLRFSWAGSAPPSQAASHFSFDRRLVRVVQTAARDLPRQATEIEVIFTGQVVQLDRGAQGDGRATLRGTVGTGPGKSGDLTVTAVLSPQLYDRAVVAHRQRRHVRVAGTLHGGDMSNVTNLEFVGPSS
ncbi:hypothetical protein KZZ52_01740 [Dactylosporangium sp. AC04546]|uniref:hypothetical protein n=1 Tax=Dactylosporangium sp. AC04546 TaxID=2862460 RepID=UPI001EDCB47B|nr:hypothetical protein [Dactylosporangium sp. AC04546]WVK84183.1 hypothetical protein KZZ52_01740 [Dactylosporangium sp. AC04546]